METMTAFQQSHHDIGIDIPSIRSFAFFAIR